MDKQDEGTMENLNTAPALAVRGRAALGLIGLWLFASTALAEPRYTVIDLGTLGGDE